MQARNGNYEPVADDTRTMEHIWILGFCPKCDGPLDVRESGIYRYYTCQDCGGEWAEKEV